MAIGPLNVIIRPDALAGDTRRLGRGDRHGGLGFFRISGGLVLAVQFALHRALRPLEQVMAALDITGKGRFDTRLPVFEVPGGPPSRAFNGMADRLAHTVDENVCLEAEREVARRAVVVGKPIGKRLPASSMTNWRRGSLRSVR